MNQVSTLSVLDSFSHKNILITGVTGFLGKSILEKLIREIQCIGKIYILIRPSTGSNAHERAQQDVFGSQLFEALRCQYGRDFDSIIAQKVQIISGDMTKKQYGLSSRDFQGLANDLDLIINSAASVDFREPMDQALNINTLSLNNILALCQCNHLGHVRVLHVSTCYVNGFNKGHIKEQVLPSASGLIPHKQGEQYDIQGVLDELDAQIQHIYSQGYSAKSTKSKLIQLGIRQSQRYGWNDTYTFTKWLGEQLLIKGMKQKNLSIVRPSIIESAVHSPLPGWVEGVKVADALIYAYAKGRVSVFPGDDNGVLDVIPVDLVSSSVLLAGAELFCDSSEYRIYQCCSGSLNPIRLKQFIGYIQQGALEQYRSLPKLFQSKPQSNFKTISPNIFGLYMMGLKTGMWFKTLKGRMVGAEQAQSLLDKANTTASLATIFGFYTAPNYQFENSKLVALQAKFSQQEQQRFNCLADSFQWKHYLQNVHLPGLHEYALSKKAHVQSLKPAHVNKAA